MKQVAGAKRKDLALHLKTPQSLIHIKHNISLFQYKVWILLLHEYKRQIDEKVPADEMGFRYLSMDFIHEKIGYEPKKQEFSLDLEKLRKQGIVFNFLEKDGQEMRYGAGFISEWKLSRLKVGFIFPTFLENVMQGLDDAKAIFLLLNWDIFNHFSGKYEAIIYKLCKDYVGIGRTPYMTVAEVREYMGILPEEYPLMEDFNRRCIKDPIKEINKSEISDISVGVTFNRKGNRIEGLYFTVSSKSDSVSAFVDYNPAFGLTKVTISPEEQKAYLAKLTPDQIQHCIERANEYGEDLERKGKKVKYGALYKTAIAENWGEQHREQKALESRKQQDAPVKDVAESTPPAKPPRMSAKKTALDRFATLDEQDKKDLIEAFIAKQKGINKARMEIEYAGIKLGIMENSGFSTPFATFLGKHWAEENGSAHAGGQANIQKNPSP